jgi:hypothetical protein
MIISISLFPITRHYRKCLYFFRFSYARKYDGIFFAA